MRLRLCFSCIALALAITPSAQAQIFEHAGFRPLFSRPAPCCQPAPQIILDPTDPKAPKIDPKGLPEAAVPGVFTDLAPSGTAGAQSFSPTMFGDQFAGTRAQSTVIVGGIPTAIFVPNPAHGGVVGRQRISEDSSPLPRDRVIFHYDYYNNAPLGQTGKDVNRFGVGIEKTFLNGRVSVEALLPFASTFPADFVANGSNGSHTELGNLTLYVKFLLYRGECVNIAAGSGFYIPTADDSTVRQTDGTVLTRIDNEAVIISPYIAAVFTPNERLFGQAWLSVIVDPTQNPVSVNTGSGLVSAGRIQDRTLLQVEGQLGYWLMKCDDPDVRLRGLAPFVEIHWEQALDNAEVARLGGFAIGDTGNQRTQVNLTTAVAAQLGNRCQLSLGAVFPLSDNRSFDYQLGFRANWLFGYSARARGVPSY